MTNIQKNGQAAQYITEFSFHVHVLMVLKNQFGCLACDGVIHKDEQAMKVYIKMDMQSIILKDG